MDLNNL